MRSRVSQARSLFRIATSQTSSVSPSAASASTSASAGLASSSRRASSSSNATRTRLASTPRKSTSLSLSTSVFAPSARIPSAASIPDRRFTSACAPTSPPQQGRGRRTPSSGNGRNLARKRSSTRAVSTKDQAVNTALRAAASIVPANPPPITANRLAWQRFFAQDRPLLEHQTVPRPRGHGQLSGALSLPGGLAEALTAATAESLVSAAEEGSDHPHHGSATLMVPATASGMAFLNFLSNNSQSLRWREPAKRVNAARFSELLDRLSIPAPSLKLTSSTLQGGAESDFFVGQSASFEAAHPVVRAESTRLREEQAFEEERAEAVRTALENGEDGVVAAALGKEADLTILGEPEGPSPMWPRGVATYLVERTRAYEAPEAPTVLADSKDAIPSIKPKGAVYITDDDPALMLSHAMVQASLPSALQWDRLTAQMEAAAIGDPLQARQGINVGNLNADMYDGVRMDSVKRKRKTKMRKHKYRKLRKRQRAERQRLKK